jgi:Bacteriophage baseplate protein W
MSDLDLIGKGWKFPIKVNAKGGLSYSDGPDRIRDAIWIVLSTSWGERLMRPDFGAGAYDYVFQPNSDVVRTQLAAAVREALLKWEPRIELLGVSVREGPQPSQVLASIDYRIRSTNELFNLVYPLYVQEGAG